MTIHVHIDRLVLNGIDLPRRARPAFTAALQQELGHLLAEGGLSPELQGGIALPRIAAPAVAFGPAASPSDMGRQIARAVYAQIGAPSGNGVGHVGNLSNFGPREAKGPQGEPE
jgi:hypothetical protein